MSGHSKWANIKTRKQAQDKRRAQVFGKLLKSIAVAVREGGADPLTNPRLRLAIERARSFNLPKENIERALSRSDSETIESFLLEAIGPGGTAMLVEGTTDNRNRTISELRRILAKHDAKPASLGGAQWAFIRRGLLVVEKPVPGKDNEAAMLALIAAGPEDVRETDEGFEVVVAAEELEPMRAKLADGGFPIADTTLGWLSQQPTAVNDMQRTALERLTAELDEHPDVQAVWTNEE